MRRGWAVSAGIVAALLISAGPASAFQETPGAPPPDAIKVAPEGQAPALELQGPATGPVQPAAKGATKTFGFSALPKLDFGLELLYSNQPLALQAAPVPQGAIPDDGDVTVLGKVKRHF